VSRAAPNVPAFAVVGGGTTGSHYVRQLLRASEAGRLLTRRIVVIDRDADCSVSRLGQRAPARRRGADLAASAAREPLVALEVASWSDWLEHGLDALPAGAHLVPHHWAPHLLLEWLRRHCERGGARLEADGELLPRGLPFDAPTRAGDRALSYADWVCPPTCIEPALCPHTRGPRHWSLADELARDAREPVDERIVFRCLHLVYGVGSIPVAEVLAARDRMLARARDRAGTYLVATASHCHGLARRVRVTRRGRAGGTGSTPAECVEGDVASRPKAGARC
jgi:hypothetical protein